MTTPEAAVRQRLTWERGTPWPISNESAWQAKITEGFRLVLEPSYEYGRFRVTVASNRQRLYWSTRDFELTSAKDEAIKQGIRVARREARLFTRIADALKAADTALARFGEGK